jgi:diamine N-acetyltransferase
MGNINNETISLVEITSENWYKVCDLTDTLSKEHRMCVAQNAYSIAEAHYSPNAWMRAIALREDLIGFVMIDTTLSNFPEGEKPAVFLWRFMIGGPWQKKGYAKQAMDIICDKYRKEGSKFLYTSCSMESFGPYGFYIKYGFVDTGKTTYDEEVLRLEL